MGHHIFRWLFFGLIVLPLGAAGATVAVHTVDDATVSGRLVSLENGSIAIDVSKGKSAPTTLPLGDVVQVVFREPPPKVKPTPKPDLPNANADAPGSIWAIPFTFGSNGNSQPTSKQAHGDGPGTRPTTQPDIPTWQIRLVNGDLLRARVDRWSGPALDVKLNKPLTQDAEIPIDQVAQVWCGSAADIAKAAALHHDPGSEDIAFVAKDDTIIPVNGHALGMEGDALKFRYADSDRKIAMSRLVGIVFATGRPPGSPIGLHQRVSLDSGDSLSGVWSGLDKDSIVLRTAWAPALRVPLKSIYTIDSVNGRLTYLSDLTPVKVEQTPYFGRVVPFRLDESLDGGPLKLGDMVYAKGIAVHSRCVLVYDIGQACERFRSRLGFEQPAGRLGRVAVRVLAGDRVLYENPDLRGDLPPVDLDFDITGQRQLTLEVDFGKGQDVGDRVIWGNARLVRAKLPG
jgi:hypothetical protein